MDNQTLCPRTKTMTLDLFLTTNETMSDGESQGSQEQCEPKSSRLSQKSKEIQVIEKTKIVLDACFFYK